MSALCGLISVDKEIQHNTSSQLWQIQYKATTTMSKLIRLFPKRAGALAKMMETPVAVAVVKAYHVTKQVAHLETGDKLEVDEELFSQILSANISECDEDSFVSSFLKVFGVGSDHDHCNKGACEVESFTETLHSNKRQKLQ